MEKSFIYVRAATSGRVTRTPVGCISYNQDGDTVRFAYSVCAKSDMKKFTKKLSRKIAEDRLQSEEHVLDVQVSTKNRHEVVRAILTKLTDKSTVAPTAVVKFGRQWLKNHEKKESVTKVENE